MEIEPLSKMMHYLHKIYALDNELVYTAILKIPQTQKGRKLHKENQYL
jgi:hypothetical protein